MAAPEAPLLYQGVSRSSAAFRLLKQMGWQEGEGLGKEKQGITQHVRVTTKKDNSGVGVDAQQKAASNWTFNTASFDSILKNLNVIIADPHPEDDKQKKAATQDAKLESASFPKKATRPQGRYKKRELAKLLKGKSQADLDAILGYGKPTRKEIWPPASEGSEILARKSPISESNCVPVERLAKDGAASTITDDQGFEEMPTLDIASDWWGTRHGFVRAGALGQQTRESRNGGQKGLEATQLAKTRVSFCEQDQEDLYKLVQDKATKGRQGLGIADRAKKIGGAHWKGQKILLDTDSDGAENEGILEKGSGNVDVSSDMDEGYRNGKLKADERLAKRRKLEDKLSWKKFCRQLLQEAPAQTMKIKDLHRQIVEIHMGSDAENCLQPLNLSKEKFKLIKSSKFVVDGKKVSIRTSL